eukprot:1977176-Rhodomonas_salina.2
MTKLVLHLLLHSSRFSTPWPDTVAPNCTEPRGMCQKNWGAPQAQPVSAAAARPSDLTESLPVSGCGVGLARTQRTWWGPS